jgi:hypothetical protein
MRPSLFHRITFPVVVLTVSALAGTACSDAPQLPTAVARSAPALLSLTPSAHGSVIRQRVADKRTRHLDAGEVARVKSLRGKWQWAADLHHTVMQEAIHDPSLGGLRRPRTAAERCEIVLRYLRKHYPDVEARLGTHRSAAERIVAIRTLAEQAGACPASQSQASLFALTMPSRTNSAHASGRVVRTANGAVNTDAVAGAWRDYVTPMLADIRTAKDLGDATEIMDTYLATAATDSDVPPASLTLIAGTIDLTTSSANEWDAFARPREGSMFMWGWLSDLGDWVASMVVSDGSGCIIGVDGWIFSSSWASLADFYFAAEASCALGGTAYSLLAAL